ncbi:MAG: dihydrolipoyl dehydrogenase [Sphaerochaetaceae bacterium]|nr:dihydrolipoyl dehydrogenase [Sphaerochaetaceae bacterium]
MAHYDLIVVGSGPGGYEAAHKAGQLGKTVLVIEKDALGGVCTNWGCIPTKSLLNSAKLYEHALHSQAKGVITTGVSFDLAAAMKWKQDTIDTLQKGIAYLMKSSDVDVLFGEAIGNRDGSITVDGISYTGEAIIIATGSSSAMIPIEGAQLDHVVTSTEILSVERLPEHLAVIGGGVIGVEFAALFSTLGVKVSVIEMTDEIIPMADKEIAKLLRREMKSVDFYLSARVVKIDEKHVFFIDKDGKERTVESDLVLMSTGRMPNTALAEQLGVFIDRRAVVVDDVLKTNIPNVYAIGDVNGKSLLAHSASRMAEVAVNNLYGDTSQRMRYDAIPWAVYTQPEVAGCGLSESEALRRGYNVKCASRQMRSNGRFLAENGKKASGLCTVVVDGETRVILGIQMIGPYASEMIHAAAVIIESELRVDEIAEVVFPHPSVSEVVKETILSLK